MALAVTLPDGVPVEGNGVIAFIADFTSITNIKAPSVAGLAAADIHTHVFGSDGWNRSSTQATNTNRRFRSSVEIVTLGPVSTTITTQYVWENGATITGAAAEFPVGTEGYFIERFAVDETTAWTVGQRVNVFKVRAGVQNTLPGAENAEDKIEQAWAVLDQAHFVALVA